MTPDVTAFFHDATCTISYLVSEPSGAPGGAHAAIVDSVLDYDARSGRSGTEAADKIVEAARERGLQVDWILETHAHADHLTAAPYLQEKLGGRIAIGARITEVQTIFKGVFNLGDDFATDGSQFDHLLGDGESFDIGAMRAEALHTPGHTPACATYVFGDAAFVGDTIFMPDFGTARCDFPGGDAATLYRSIQRILALPPEKNLIFNR